MANVSNLDIQYAVQLILSQYDEYKPNKVKHCSMIFLFSD